MYCAHDYRHSRRSVTRFADSTGGAAFSSQSDPDLPFQGGALGLFGYDLGRRFEILPDTAARDIALPDMAIGLYDWALIVDHHKQVVSLISYHDADARYRWLTGQRAPTRTSFRLTSARQSNMTRCEYGEKFRQVQAGCTAGTAIRSIFPSVFRRATRVMNGRLSNTLTAPIAPRSAPFFVYMTAPY